MHSESKEYPPDRDGNVTRETIAELADGSVHREGGIEEGPDKGRRWSKWDEKPAKPIPDAPSEAPLWEADKPNRIEALRAQRYGLITAASENGSGQAVDDAWLHAEADVEELPADPFSAEDLARIDELTADQPVIEFEGDGVKTAFRRNEDGEGRVTVQIIRELADGTKLTRGEHRDEARRGSGWITRELPPDARIPSELRLPTDDGSTIGELRLKKATFNFGPDAPKRLFIEYVGRRESE
jgi:hypothetical protein